MLTYSCGTGSVASTTVHINVVSDSAMRGWLALPCVLFLQLLAPEAVALAVRLVETMDGAEVGTL